MRFYPEIVLEEAETGAVGRRAELTDTFECPQTDGRIFSNTYR